MGSGASASLLDQTENEQLDTLVETLSQEQRERIKASFARAEGKHAAESSGDGSAARAKESANEKMQRILGNGDVRVIRPSWMKETADDWILQRMQDLPRGAFSETKPVAALFQEELTMEDYIENMLIVVSYAWLSRRHPDPHGFHVRRLKFAMPMSKYRRLVRESKGIFMDFMSLPQADHNGERTDAEVRTFKEGLSIINFLYGSERTFVMQLTAMPSGKDWFEGMNSVPYEKRGWCRFEETVSGIIKPKPFMMNVGNLEDVMNAKLGQTEFAQDLLVKATGSPKVPVSPAAMEQILQDSIFTNGSDTDKVANMYRTFFEQVSCTTTALFLAPLSQALCMGKEGHADASRRGWQGDESRQLAEALPAFAACKELFLSGSDAIDPAELPDIGLSIEEFGGHPLGDDGVQCLVIAMAKMPALETLAVALCDFGEDTLAALQAALISSISPLKRLSLPRNLECTQSGQCFKKAWADAGKDPTNLHWESGDYEDS